MQNVPKKVFDFFTHPDTPGSGFYLAALAVLSSVGDYLMGSGNPLMMGIGAACAAVYAAANTLGNAVQTKAAYQASTAAGPPTVNDTPFGTPKVGPDYAPPASSVAIPDAPAAAAPEAAPAAAQAPQQPQEPAPAPPAPTADDLAGVQPSGQAFWNVPAKSDPAA